MNIIKIKYILAIIGTILLIIVNILRGEFFTPVDSSFFYKIFHYCLFGIFFLIAYIWNEWLYSELAYDEKKRKFKIEYTTFQMIIVFVFFVLIIVSFLSVLNNGEALNNGISF